MAEKRPSVIDVAARAGVSIATVSRVLNDRPSTEETRAKVLAAVDELGYRPNPHARSLKSQPIKQLAFAVADVGNPVYVEMMRAVENETRARGYRLLVSSTGGRIDDTIALTESLEDGYADGLILSPVRVVPALVEALRTFRLPMVVIGRVPTELEVDNVRANSAGGVRLALNHLVEQGCKRVAIVNGPSDTVPGERRGKAFERIARELGLDPDPALRVEAGDFTLLEGVKAANTLFDRTRPDAVIGGNDLLAIATMQVISDRGLKVPDDVAVVGIDDTELAGVTSPPLTSIGLGAAARGRAAAQLLLDRIDDPKRPAKRITIQPELTVRGSSQRGGRR